MPPLVVIVGATASGKTALAIELAKRLNGEIITADSRTVYKGMDIGTAKPTMDERSGIRHYGLDVIAPGEHFSAYDFQKLALTAINEIHARGKLPIMVGGTGLYVDGVLYDFHFRGRPSDQLREALQNLSTSELQERIKVAQLPMPENAQNPRHLTRVLESGAAPQQARILRSNTLVLGLTLPRDELKKRIEERVNTMVAAGLVQEVSTLLKVYGDTWALQTPGYEAFSAYVRGEVSLEEAKHQFVRADLYLAKRQRTWFKRNKDIHWLISGDRLEEASKLISNYIKT